MFLNLSLKSFVIRALKSLTFFDDILSHCNKQCIYNIYYLEPTSSLLTARRSSLAPRTQQSFLDRYIIYSMENHKLSPLSPLYYDKVIVLSLFSPFKVEEAEDKKKIDKRFIKLIIILFNLKLLQISRFWSGLQCTIHIRHADYLKKLIWCY